MTSQNSSISEIASVQCAGEGAESPAPEHVIAVAGESGWIPAEDLKSRAMDALTSSGSVTLDFAQVEYLEASGLQVALAIVAACSGAGKALSLIHVSPNLKAWFEQCGAASHLLTDCAVKQ